MTLQQDFTDLETPTGAMRTFRFRPAAAGRYPGLMLFSEIFQVTGPIRRMAAMLAGHGFVVAVPEIFHELEPAGTELAYDQEGADRGNRYKVSKTVAAYDADAAAVIAHLRAHPACTGRLGAMGICIGGHLSYRAAFHPDIRASACFYATDLHTRSLGAGGDDSLERAAEIQAEVLMIWGRQDPHIPAEGRALILQRMSEAGIRFTWHEFNGAHAFMRDEGYRYDPALALLGYRMAIDLFARRLGEGEREAS